MLTMGGNFYLPTHVGKHKLKQQEVVLIVMKSEYTNVHVFVVDGNGFTFEASPVVMR